MLSRLRGHLAHDRGPHEDKPMTAALLRVVEPATDALIDRLPSPSLMELPSLESLGRRADETVGRLRGRPRRPAWTWLLGVVAIMGIALVAASVVMTWTRNRGEPDHDDAFEGLDQMSAAGSLDGPDLGATADLPVARGHVTGLTAAEGSLLSHDPIEGRDG
jgi:hypothetical protein